ncbi:hypothetical protein HOLleu_08771 [Holothuria leucospilota]|uniref:Uncharacterized protein n=1 Tax=Holothuria leucospilota TaxID=206669 RepID=A0A9Q1CI15_HOLLE|nr:hypothetical protein HOLleu_08771 [Holothuria leucospilota]
MALAIITQRCLFKGPNFDYTAAVTPSFRTCSMCLLKFLSRSISFSIQGNSWILYTCDRELSFVNLPLVIWTWASAVKMSGKQFSWGLHLRKLWSAKPVTASTKGAQPEAVD